MGTNRSLQNWDAKSQWFLTSLLMICWWYRAGRRGCHTEEPRQAGEVGWQEPREVQPEKMARDSCMHLLWLGTDHWESNFAEKELEVLEDSRLTLSSDAPVVAKKANSILGCISDRLRNLILPLYSIPLSMCVVCNVQFWAALIWDIVE